MTNTSFHVERVRHPIKMRLLTVKRITELSPSMRRITLTGKDLDGFISASFDDHVKLIVPDVQGGKPSMPTVGDSGLMFEPGRPKPAMRDYTPRSYDPLTRELDIDFVLHHDGPATHWASRAEPGHSIGIGGPRGSFVIPMTFDWHLLIGDETALPAIGRRLEEFPPETRAIAVIKTGSDDARIKLDSQCELQMHWVSDTSHATLDMDALETTVRRLDLPQGEGFIWAAGEYSTIKAIRQHLVDDRGIDKSRIRASSYWRTSTPDAHEQF